MSDKLRILVLEDNASDADLEIAQLEEAGYSCEWERVETREEFLAALGLGTYDLILADYCLPSFDGPSALKIALERQLDLPFIVISGTIGEETAIECLKAGATDYVLKQNMRRLGPAVSRAIRDREEKKRCERAEMAMRAAELKFHHLVEASADAIIIADESGEIVYCNQGAQSTFGYTVDEMLGKPLTQFMPDRYEHSHRDALKRAISKGRPLNAGNTRKVDGLRKDGSEVPLEISLSAWTVEGTFFCGAILRDITQRKQAEETLRSSEERYRSLFESSRDAIYMSTPEGRLFDVNQACVRLFEFHSKRELLKADIAHELYQNPADRSTFTQQLHEKGFLKDYELKLRTRKGRNIIVLESATVVRDVTGKIVGHRGIMRDVTKQRELEEQFLQAQKMEAIGRLAGGVAHDFNNLLNLIMGYCELLLMQSDTTEAQRRKIGEIHKAGQQATLLTSQLLAFGRKQLVQPQVLNLNAVLTSTEKMLRRLVGEDIELVCMLEPGLVSVKADPGQLEQVLMNLAVNARDAMPLGGKLTIKTSNVILDEEYARINAGITPGRYAMLTVTDTGCGIEEEVREHIFEPFFTTKEKGKGTGLGLSTVYGIVSQNGGDLSVFSEADQGATFKICLPQAEVSESADASVKDEAIAADYQGSETVLVAEDQGGVRRLAREFLEKCGYRVLEAVDGSDALRLAQSSSGSIHLLVTDVVMPGMSGRELADRIIALRPEIKVLYMSGYTDEVIIDHGVWDRVHFFIRKPFGFWEFARGVREVLDGKEPEVCYLTPSLGSKEKQNRAS